MFCGYVFFFLPQNGACQNKHMYIASLSLIHMFPLFTGSAKHQEFKNAFFLFSSALFEQRAIIICVNRCLPMSVSIDSL